MSHTIKVVGGAQTYSRQGDRYVDELPHQLVRGAGAYVYDMRGERYLDTVNGLGAVTLGHRHPAVDEAVRTQLDSGIAMPTGGPMEGVLAAELAHLVPSHLDAVRYGKNGADVTGAAVRLARAVRGVDRIAMSATGYHGHHDWSMTRPPKDGGVPAVMRDLTDHYQWGSIAHLHAMLRAQRYAAVVVEPVESGFPYTQGVLTYLKRLRELCDEYGVLLIYDEVVTGLRVEDWTYSRRMGNAGPDLLCLGKGLANGHAVSALVGRSQHMERITEGDVFFSTTHGGEAASLAAAVATLRFARRHHLWAVLQKVGRAIQGAFNYEAAQLRLNAEAIGYPARPFFTFADPERRDAFLDGLARRNVLCQGYVNLSWAMTDPKVYEPLIDAISDALHELT